MKKTIWFLLSFVSSVCALHAQDAASAAGAVQPAHAIAEAAKQFGQQDDMSVLSVTRSGVREAAFAGVG
jgi:hypothetical protein